MWLASSSPRRIGQGMSLLIFANVVSSLPSAARGVDEAGRSSSSSSRHLARTAVLIVYVDQASVEYRHLRETGRGRKEMGGNSTYIPLKVNQSA